MISGGGPFPRESTAATIAAVLGEQPRPFAPSVPEELQRIVRKCLEKDSARRYSAGGDLLVDLRTLIRDTAAPTLRDAERRRGRRRALYIASIGGALALLAGTAWTILRPPAAPGGAVRVLAILPFVTDATPSDYLGDGISESVINSLSQLPQLKVLARTTTFRYRGGNVDLSALRKELGVDAVVTGRVVHQGESLVVSAELTNAADGSQIWGQRYSNHRLADVFAVQEAIAREIAGGLKLGLAGREAGFSKRYTEDVEAYRLYVVGRERAQRRTVADLQAAADLYRQAIARDQRYALAWAGLTDTYILLGARGALPAAESRTLASEAASRAYAIDPELAEANAASGQIDAYLAPFDFEASRPQAASRDRAQSGPGDHASVPGGLITRARPARRRRRGARGRARAGSVVRIHHAFPRLRAPPQRRRHARDDALSQCCATRSGVRDVLGCRAVPARGGCR